MRSEVGDATTEEQKRLPAEEWWAKPSRRQRKQLTPYQCLAIQLRGLRAERFAKETCAALVNESSALRTWFNFTALAATPGCVDA